jgi:hypothetical protein
MEDLFVDTVARDGIRLFRSFSAFIEFVITQNNEQNDRGLHAQTASEAAA